MAGSPATTAASAQHLTTDEVVSYGDYPPFRWEDDFERLCEELRVCGLDDLVRMLLRYQPNANTIGLEPWIQRDDVRMWPRPPYTLDAIETRGADLAEAVANLVREERGVDPSHFLIVILGREPSRTSLYQVHDALIDIVDWAGGVSDTWLSWEAAAPCQRAELYVGLLARRGADLHR